MLVGLVPSNSVSNSSKINWWHNEPCLQNAVLNLCPLFLWKQINQFWRQQEQELHWLWRKLHLTILAMQTTTLCNIQEASPALKKSLPPPRSQNQWCSPFVQRGWIGFYIATQARRECCFLRPSESWYSRRGIIYSDYLLLNLNEWLKGEK